MAIRMYNKAELNFVDGYLTHNGEVLVVDGIMADQWNTLETMVQKHVYDVENYVEPVKEAPEFERVTLRNCKKTIIHSNTPALDKAVEEAKAIFKETAIMDKVNEANETLEKLDRLREFVNNDHIVASTDGTPVRIDTPMIGDITKIQEQDLVTIVMFTVADKAGDFEEFVGKNLIQEIDLDEESEE